MSPVIAPGRKTSPVALVDSICGVSAERSRSHVRCGGLAGRLAEREPGFDLVAFVAQLIDKPAGHQYHGGHGVADHHADDRYQGAALQREDPQSEHHTEGDHRGGREGDDGQSAEPGHLRNAAARDVAGVEHHACGPGP